LLRLRLLCGRAWRRYSVNFESPPLSKLRAHPSLGRFGCLSPWDTLTVEGETRERLSIPAEASFFAWAFPLMGLAEASAGVAQTLVAPCTAWLSPTEQLAVAASLPQLTNLEELLDGATPELAFVANGGFIYANSSFAPVAARAVVGKSAPGDGIAFDGPHVLSMEMRSRLELNGRLVPPTNPQHVKAGVTGFTWVEPSEEELHEGAHKWRMGSFVYCYDDRRLDRYFHVRCEPEVPSRGMMNLVRGATDSVSTLVSTKL
jgi:hypothetical protein